jgi:SAM-dependent methyltransferase
MARLARLARAHGRHWSTFHEMYAAAIAARTADVSPEFAEVLVALHPTEPLPEVREAFLLALRSAWVRPSLLTRSIVDYLMLDPRVERVTERTPPTNDDFVMATAHLAQNELFAALLQTTVVSDLRLERMLIVLRDYLLTVPPSAPGVLRLAALIATQANLVEYLWPCTTGPIDTRDIHAVLPPPVRGARALLNSMFRAPTAAEVAAIESIAANPAITCLLERVRDEPTALTRHRDEIERAALSLGTVATRSTPGQPRACPRWTKEPRVARTLPPEVSERLRLRHFEGGEVLLVGCGSGQELFTVSATYPRAHITALDANIDKLAYAAHKCAQAGVQGVDFLAGTLLDVPPLGWTFDLVECAGLQRQLPDPEVGCEALARATRPGSLLRVAVYGDTTCRLISALRAARQIGGFSRSLEDLNRFRTQLLEGQHGALPPALLQSTDFHTASGLRDLLFSEGEVGVAISTWLALFDRHGFEFVCEEINGELIRAARTAGFSNAASWSIRDCKRFERGHPFAFDGAQFLWFERRDSRRR